MEYYQKGVSSAPGFYYTHLEFGKFLRAQKQTDRAVAEYARASEMNPENADARLEIVSFANERKDFASAVRQYEWLVRWAESEAAAARGAVFRARLFFDYGFALASTGQHDKAALAYDGSLQFNPKEAITFNNAGYEYAQIGNAVKAEEYYRASISIDPSYIYPNRNLAKLLLTLNRFEEGRIQAEKALAIKPDDASIMLLIGRAWAAQGKKKQSLEWIGKAVAAGYKDSASIAGDALFTALRDNGDFKKLLEQMRKPK
jgi:tetratricopeptide (TPR) repeat protein